jgi:chromosome segregation ATPase
MRKTPLAISLLCVGLLAVTALASPVTAKDGGDQPSASERRDAAKERMENRSADREERKDRMREAHDAWQDCKHDANATGNESRRVRCGDERAFFLNATKARREGATLYGAIAALERRIGRLEAREIALEQQVASGNLSANETAESQEKIEKIDSHQERMVELLHKLQERLAALHEKWQSVRDHVAEKRHGDDSDDGAVDDKDDGAVDDSDDAAVDDKDDAAADDKDDAAVDDQDDGDAEDQDDGSSSSSSSSSAP